MADTTRRESYNPLLKSYPDSDKINSVSEGAEVLYVRLIAQSDDAGRYYGSADWVLAKLFTARMIAGKLTESEVENRLQELENVGLIQRYQAAGGTYLQMVNVCKRIRKDVQPYLSFPKQLTIGVTDTLRTRNVDVTDTGRQPNPTQPIPNPNKSPSEISPELPSARSGPACAPHEEPSEFSFPTTGKGPREWVLSNRKLAEYVEAYPSLDVRRELSAARQWCRDNANRRKTATGMAAFLTRWMNKAVNERGGQGASSRGGTNGREGHVCRPLTSEEIHSRSYNPITGISDGP